MIDQRFPISAYVAPGDDVPNMVALPTEVLWPPTARAHGIVAMGRALMIFWELNEDDLACCLGLLAHALRSKGIVLPEPEPDLAS